MTSTDCLLDPNISKILAWCRKGSSKKAIRRQLLKVIHGYPRCIHPDVKGSRELLTELFLGAGFEIPPEVPEVVTLYRGVSGISPENAAKGYYWTNNIYSAGEYAIGRSIQRGIYTPFVIQATVAKSAIAVVNNAGGHSAADRYDPNDIYEIIVTTAPDEFVLHCPSLPDVVDMVERHKVTYVKHAVREKLTKETMLCVLLRMNKWLDNYKSQSA